MTVRRVFIWQAVHDNGWISRIAEQNDGTFVAWAGAADSSGVDYIEDTLEQAHAAALFALKRKSGHAVCSAQCSGWEMHTDALTVGVPDPRPADSLRESSNRSQGPVFINRVLRFDAAARQLLQVPREADAAVHDSHPRPSETHQRATRRPDCPHLRLLF